MNITQSPALLYIGKPVATAAQATSTLQKGLCKQDSCHTCIDCRNIDRKQHPFVRWIKPEKNNYTLDDLEAISKAISFALAPEERFFFVLEQADFLTTVCANSLLKSIEEPPAGYQFILLAQRAEALLPTIRSRCIITTLNSSDNTNLEHDLFAFFTAHKPINPASFLKALDESKITERESVELLDRAVAYWITYSKKQAAENNNAQYAQSVKKIALFSQAITNPPMPGSSKLLWRNLFLQLTK